MKTMETMKTKRIKKVGVELEGGWERKPRDLDLHEDISLKEVSGNYVGEIKSPPMSFPEIEKWIKKNYPSFCNETCGFHIHISLRNNLDYARLMSQDFYEYFLSEIKKWAIKKKIDQSHEFWKRFNGENQFCQKIFLAEKQVLNKDKNSIRYTHVNYCLRLHGTIEFRLFPMWKETEIAISSVRKVVEIVETYLARQPKEKQFKLVIRDFDELVFEKRLETDKVIEYR